MGRTRDANLFARQTRQLASLDPKSYQLKKTEEQIAEVKANSAEALQEARKRAAEEIHRAAQKLQQRDGELAECHKETKTAAAQLVEALQRQVEGQRKTEPPAKKS